VTEEQSVPHFHQISVYQKYMLQRGPKQIVGKGKVLPTTGHKGPEGE
jgi:hypothetical protein